MYGLGDEFEYLRCGACGCQQIVEVPADLGKYYPADYYSYAPAPLRGLRRVITSLRNESYFKRTPAALVGRLISAALPNPKLASVARLKPSTDARILDVGCGYGELLMEMRGIGFTRLCGIDPYIAADLEPCDGVVIRKMGMDELSGNAFDVIMMHHVFEHLADPVAALRSVRGLLAPRGICIIRIPVADSWASQHYGPFWVQHDAPRHLFLHTEKSMQCVAAEAGLQIERVVYDSSEAQIWGSELYRRDIALRSVPLSVYGNPLRRLLSPEFRRYRATARRLNRQGQGDQAAFYLRRVN
jgi:SAM-dependent methyltransferase